MSAAPVPLSVIVGWDLPALRGSVGTLRLVAERLVPWLTRVDALSRQLTDAECWSGPAATVAGSTLVQLGSLGSLATGALTDSGDALARAVGDADQAQEHAETALAVAATGPVTLTDDGQVAVPPPVATAVTAADQLAALAEQEQAGRRAAAWAALALEAAARVVASAGAAEDALAGVVVAGGLTPTPPPGSGSAPVVPTLLGPQDAADWWTGLTPAERLAVVAADPSAVGGQDGLPAWARDQANRALLAGALADPTAPGADTARATADQLAAVEADGQTAQLLVFDAAEGRVALGVGDLDTAGAVGVLVPGMNTTAADDLDGLTTDASAVQSLAEAAAPGLAVATLVWLGYRTPGWRSFAVGLGARSAGPVLDRALDGLAAARTAGASVGGPAVPRTTLLAHSYGSLVAGEAARAEGELSVDALVLLGSPGTGARDAESLEADEVYGAWSPFDPVSFSDWFGGSPFDSGFGDTPLPTTPVQLHTEYYSPYFPTLEAIADVVAGTRDPG